MAIHQFQPTRYYRNMGTYPAVLAIAPGDTVVTTTVDAHGRDATGEMITERGNPMTGPFFIEGAEPGDTLVVHLDQIAPNRATGWSGAVLSPNVVEPEYTPELPWPPKGQPWQPTIWNIDGAAGVARLASPPAALAKLALPLAPMLGCFGVAPWREQAISTATSAEHGGNMDYRGFVAGVTVYFPVFSAGALFFLGDGHAVQGDGEIVGTGIEISMDVQFTVDLLKGKPSRWPRGENATHIFTVGNARPLDQCVQHATTEMVRWLEADYGLDAPSANILLGQAVEYDLANVYDPAYTMVCKLPKVVLAQLKG